MASAGPAAWAAVDAQAEALAEPTSPSASLALGGGDVASDASRKYPAVYRTPHAKVAGTLSVSPELLRFRPSEKSRHVQQQGAVPFTVLVEVPDVLECGAVAMPFEGPSGAAYFLQLHLRTLDGRNFRTTIGGRGTEEAEDPWRAVFQLKTRDDLYEAARIILDAAEEVTSSRVLEGAAAELPEGSQTSVPHVCLDCFSEFEALQAQRQAAQAAAPAQATATASLASGARNRPTWLSNLGAFLRAERSESSASSSPTHRRPSTPSSPQGGLVKRRTRTFSEQQLDSATSSQPAVSLIVLRHEDCPKGVMMTHAMAECVNDFLPVSLRLPGAAQWVLRYTPKVDGVSLSTLFRNLEDCRFTVVLIKDAESRVFGGYAPEVWAPRGKFYGGGEGFVFQFSSLVADDPQLEVYPWTSKNTYVMYADKKCFAMGGGDGHHAFAIESDLLRGFSSPTPTFGNPTLAASEEFVVRDVEIWSIEEVD